MASISIRTLSKKLSAVQRVSVVGLCIATLPSTAGRAEAPQVPALVIKAAKACFSSVVRFTGLVVPRAEAVINLNIEGYEIAEVLVAEGDVVTSGQVLAKLTRLAGGPAGMTAANTSGGALGTASVQQNPEMALRAPAGGVVSRSTAKVGMVAAAIPLPPPMGPEPLFRIIVGGELEIEAEVPSVQLPKLKAGQLARVRLDNGREFTGEIRTILPEVDRRTQLGKARLTVEKDPAVFAGMFASGTIDASHSCGVSVRRSAVQYRTEGTTVQVVQGTTVETRHVRVGFFSESNIEVLEGVKEGELVIANAGTSLHDGDQVKPILADEFSE